MQSHQITKRKKTTIKWPLAIMLASVTTISVAAESGSLTITGTITPSSCNVNLTSNNVGAIDYGPIDASALSQNAFRQYTSIKVPITIECGTKAKVAIKLTDNRANSLAAGLMTAMATDLTDNDGYGLGLSSDGKKIGGYFITVNQDFTADAKTVQTLKTADNGSTWQHAGVGVASPGKLLTWGSAVPNTPTTIAAFNKVTGTMTVTPGFNKSSELSLTAPIKLDGSSSVQLVYL